MPEPVGLLVVAAEGSSSLTRLRTSLARYNVDGLPLSVVPSTSDALALAASSTMGVWVVLDPKVQFIRNFGLSDVMSGGGTPFTFASEEREWLVAGGEPDAGLETVRTELGVSDRRRLVSRGLSTWSSAVVGQWSEEWLGPRGWSFADALERCPDPQAWYLTWLLRTRPAAIALHAPIVAMLDTASARREADILGTTTVDLARAYVGVVLDGTEEVDSLVARPARSQVIAQSVSMRELGRALALRSTRKAPRVQRWLGLTPPG